MLCALNAAGEDAYSFQVERADGPWVCRSCKSPVVYRKGSHISAHFAHKPGFDGSCCAVVTKYGGSGGESLKHLLLKKLIYLDALAVQKEQGKIKEVHLEYPVGKSIADVAIIGSVRKIAVEVQISSMKLEAMVRRMAEHRANGFSTLWVLDPPADIEELRAKQHHSQYSARALTRDVHRLSAGAIFFYAGGLRFHVVHLMGHRYVRYKYHKFIDRTFSLFELIDNPYRFDMGLDEDDYDAENYDGETLFYNVVTLHKRDRWWIEWAKRKKEREAAKREKWLRSLTPEEQEFYRGL